MPKDLAISFRINKGFKIYTLTIATAFFSISASSLNISFLRLKQFNSVEAKMWDKVPNRWNNIAIN